MRASQVVTPRALGLMWSRGPRLLERATAVVIGLALVLDATLMVLPGDGLGGSWVALCLALAGVLLGYRFPFAGLVLMASSPVTAALLGSQPIAYWSLACFGALLLTLRGLPGLVTGAVIGTANLAAAGIAAGSVAPSVDPAPSIAAFAALMMAAAGSAIRGHRRYWSELEQRTQEAIASRAAAVERSLAEERIRIARDLHDSVGHEIAVVSMHLGSAEVHLPPDAAEARADLAAARAGVQSVLRETQQILRVLRVGSDAATLAPTPDHGQIAALVESCRAAGLEVTASLAGLDVPLAPNVSVAAYRIVQEALTNAQRHGTGAVSLRIDRDARDGMTIEAANLRSRSGATEGGGNGLVGMRERAESAGGRLDVLRDDTFFRVRAQLPGQGAPAGRTGPDDEEVAR